MFAALLGVASFHRACLLAQDFTHEPACQTGERAPQGRFRHQPEQMVHPPFAWQLASFPSLPVCGEEAPYCPLRDFATLRTYSPEIKARQALFAFLPVYPELVGVVGSRVPDYRGRFLRGLQSGYSVGQTVANSLKSHNHTQPTHTHSFSGQLVSTALSGTAAGQSFSSAANLGVSGWAAGQSITSGGAGGQSFSYQGSTASSSGGYVTFRHDTGTTNGYGAGGIIPGYSATPPTASWGITITENNGVFYSKYSSGSGGDRSTVTTSYVPFSGAKAQTMGGVTSGGSIWGSTGGGSVSGTASGTISGTANASSVSGNLRNGSVSGVIDAGGGNPTDYTGGSETAPDHIYVRCLIRAKP